MTATQLLMTIGLTLLWIAGISVAQIKKRLRRALMRQLASDLAFLIFYGAAWGTGMSIFVALVEPSHLEYGLIFVGAAFIIPLLFLLPAAVVPVDLFRRIWEPPVDLTLYDLPVTRNRSSYELVLSHVTDLHLTDDSTLESELEGTLVLHMATDGIKKSLKGSNFVLITGDITDQGRAGEWSQFHNLLASLDSPLDSGRVMMVPGNHDLSLVTSHNPSTMARIAYDRNAYRFISAVLSKCPPGWTMHTPDGFISVRGYLEEVAEYLDCYGRHPPYARGAPPHGNLDVWFPEELVAAYDKLNKPLWPNRRWQMCHDFLRLAYPMVFLDNDKYLIVGLNSCDEVAETIFDSAIGRLGDGQIKRLKTILSNAGARTVIILMHHHLGIPEEVWELMRRDQSALAIRSLALRDASKLQRILANVTNCIVFHGHKHVGYYAQVGKTLVVSGPSITFPDRYALAKSDRYVLGADGLKAFS